MTPFVRALGDGIAVLVLAVAIGITNAEDLVAFDGVHSANSRRPGAAGTKVRMSVRSTMAPCLRVCLRVP